ncbi:MAG: flagellar hook-associated protein FlgK [Janthinobacterium lividum]
MSDLMSIGASGVRAYQAALGTVSENIANAGTAGYARRTTTLAEVTATGGLSQSKVLAGNGVTLTGIGRLADTYKAAAVRTSASDLARTEAGATWLDQVQTALTGNQLGDRLTGFFAASTTLAADPTSSAARATMLEAGTSVAGAFGGTGRALDQVASNLDSTADDATGQLDTLGQSLAAVNDGLGRAAPGSSAAASLADQRDSITEQMSAIADVDVATDAQGRATVRLGGGGGPVFVAGNDAGHVTYARNDSGAVSFAVHRDGHADALVPNGGALAGIADAAGRIGDARAGLNTLATSFANGVNAVQAQGDDLNGKPGGAMFSTGASPTDLTLSLGDPSGIAAAARGGGSRDNSNLTALAGFRTSGAVEAKTTSLVADTAAALAAKQTVADAQTTIHDGAVTARDAVSGVNLDTEAVDLMRFQQAYQASSRVIQVARETFQSIIAIN